MIKAIYQGSKTLEQLHWLFDMDKLEVEGYPDLYRDPRSGAIIKKSSTEYQSYIDSYNSRKQEKEKITTIENDLNDLKNEIGEIKEMLRKIFSQ